MIRNFYSNFAPKVLAVIFVAPLVPVVALSILDKFEIIHFNMNIDIVLTTLSIILIANMTAFFAISASTLTALHKDKSSEHGDSLRSILIARYKFVMYLSFILITLLALCKFITISTPDGLINILSYKYFNYFNFLFIYTFLVILVLNILLVRNYFGKLPKSMKTEQKENKADKKK